MLKRSHAHESSPHSYVWTTQFNDLRPERDSSPDSRRRRIARELVFQGIFQNKIIIRDADLVNQPELLRMIAEDDRRILKLLRTGAIALGLRSHARSFAQVNREAGRSRAFPERAEEAAVLLEHVDAKIERWATILEVVEDAPGMDRFRANLERVLARARLSVAESAALKRGLEAAATGPSDAPLRFGELYRHLVQVENFEPDSDLVQWCRAAHVLIGPQSMGLAPIAVDDDLSPEKLGLLLDLEPTSGYGEEEWGGELPRRILSSTALDQLDFLQVAELRRVGEATGYYSALDAVREASPGRPFERAFTSYVEALDCFLIAMGQRPDVELVDWQRELIDREVESRKQLVRGITAGIPAVVSVAGWLMTLHPSLRALGEPLVGPAAGAASAAGALLGLSVEGAASRRLDRVRGVTAYPRRS